MTIKLSICIPTLNRLNFLKENLDNLLPQIQGKSVEICVSNNCSDDATADYLNKVKGIKIINHPKRLTLDKSMQAVAEMACGEYVFLLGDDDCLMPNAIEKILAKLNCSMLLLNCWHADKNLKHQNLHLSDSLTNRTFNDPKEALKNLWDKMPFGSFIAKREAFDKKFFEKFIGTSHAYSGCVWQWLSKIENPTIHCMKEPTVLIRGADKTWESQRAEIMLLHIPMWFSLLIDNSIYKCVAKKIKARYLKSNSKRKYLAQYVKSKQLGWNNFSYFSAELSFIAKLRILRLLIFAN